MVGVCFGHQIMAEALGGHVEKSNKGWGAGLHRYRVVHGEPWIDRRRHDRDPRIAPGSGPDPAAEHRDRRSIVVYALCRRSPGPIDPPSTSSSTRNSRPAFAKALIEKRYDIVPDPDAAIASLDAPNDNARVGGWIRRFLRLAARTEKLMKTRAAVAFAAKQPLEIVELDLEGPRRAKCWSRSWPPASATPTPTRSTGSTAKGCFRRSSVTKARASCARSGRA